MEVCPECGKDKRKASVGCTASRHGRNVAIIVDRENMVSSVVPIEFTGSTSLIRYEDVYVWVY